MKIGNEDVKLYLGSAEVEKIYLGTEQVYGGSEPTHDYSQDYLTIESLEDGNNTISFTMGNGMTTAITTAVTSVSVSTDDGQSWTQMQNIGARASLSVILSKGEKAIWKGEAVRYALGIGSTGKGRQTIFSSTGQFKVYGNIMSLISGDTFEDVETLTGALTFCGLFRECTGLTSAENLILPATTLVNGCYSGMFEGCTGLTTAPELPATTLAERCYRDMFKNCTNLTSITCLATDISASSCTSSWVDGVSSTGTFVKAASMSSWTTGTSGIPTGWTVQDAD